MSIRLKLVVMFLAGALIPLLLVSALTYHNYKHSLEKNRLAQLRDVVAFKTDKIETYFDGLKANLELLQHSAAIMRNLPLLARLAANPADLEYAGAQKAVDEVMRNTALTFDIFDIVLVDAGGKVVYALNPKHRPFEMSKPLPDAVRAVHEHGKSGLKLSDIYVNKIDDNKLALLMTAPIFDANDVPAGTIAMEVDMATVDKIIQDVTGLGNTGETLIGKKYGNQVLYLNPLRHDPKAALQRRVTMGSLEGVPIQKAVEGRSGAGLSVDYRGETVVAAWRYMPSLDWGVVAKIDAQEAFADVRNLRNLIFMILGIIVILSGIMAVSLAQSISGPLRKVAQGAEIIGGGNLDYQVGSNHKDEIGRLAGSLDKMARDLKNLGADRDAERQRLFGVLEALPVYVILLTEDYHVPFANRFFRERFGESHGRRCYEYLFNRSEPCENCETFKVLQTGKPQRWEWTGPDGRNYDIYDYLFHDSDGSRKILEMGIDITEQKQAQASLRSATLYTRNLIEVSLDPLVTISSDGKITDVNEAAVKVTGVPREQLVGDDFSDYFTEPEKAREGYLLVFAKGFVADYPLTIRHKDGRLTDVLYNASVYKDVRGNVLGVFAAARDVTIQNQTSRYARSLLEASLDPLVTIEAGGKITDVNEATVKVTGVPRAQLVGDDFSDYFTEPEKAREGYRLVFAKGFVADYPLTIRRKDGHLTDVLYNASVYKDMHGNVLGVFAAARDVTLQKKAEAELRRHRDNLEVLVEERTAKLEATNKALERSNENLKQFAYVASHDLQEPLRIMASYSQLLGRRYKGTLNKDADEFIEYIVDAAVRMQKLITDLLEYSRAGSENANMVEVDCNEIVNKTIVMLSGTIEANHARVTHDNLPVVTAHATGLIHLFQNLIGNALKFHGKEQPVIHIAVRKDKKEWIFSVRDNGIGIDPQYKERIFQIFQRLHARGDYPGTGIGLSICKKIVENHRGSIWVESEVGKGAIFYFTIPMR